MLQKLLVNLLFGVSALILFSKPNWYGVYCEVEMGEPIKSLSISQSGGGIEIHIRLIGNPVPAELNTTVHINRAVCIEIMKDYYNPSINGTTGIRMVGKHSSQSMRQAVVITKSWSKRKNKFYMCTSPQVANFFFYRVEQIYFYSTKQVSKAFLYDERLEAEPVEIESGDDRGKSTANIKVVTYRVSDDRYTEWKYSGAVKIITL